MFEDKRLLNIIVNNLLIVLGLSFLFVGIFIMYNQVNSQENMTAAAVYLDFESLELDYNRLSDLDNEAKEVETIEEVELLIPPGSSGLTVANLLDDADLLSAEEFRKYIYLFDIEKRLQAGSYRFKKNDTAADILNRILID